VSPANYLRLEGDEARGAFELDGRRSTGILSVNMAGAGATAGAAGLAQSANHELFNMLGAPEPICLAGAIHGRVGVSATARPRRRAGSMLRLFGQRRFGGDPIRPGQTAMQSIREPFTNYLTIKTPPNVDHNKPVPSTKHQQPTTVPPRTNPSE
jgi:hypothetical protein